MIIDCKLQSSMKSTSLNQLAGFFRMYNITNLPYLAIATTSGRCSQSTLNKATRRRCCRRHSLYTRWEHLCLQRLPVGENIYPGPLKQPPPCQQFDAAWHSPYMTSIWLEHRILTGAVYSIALVHKDCAQRMSDSCACLRRGLLPLSHKGGPCQVGILQVNFLTPSLPRDSQESCM